MKKVATAPEDSRRGCPGKPPSRLLGQAGGLSSVFHSLSWPEQSVDQFVHLIRGSLHLGLLRRVADGDA